jgi:hypothetical protein
MDEFLKCECSHCGQRIEYPSEGIGQTVPCPTCEKPVTLTTAVKRGEIFNQTPLPEVTIPKAKTVSPRKKSERQKKEQFLLQQKKELEKSLRQQKKKWQAHVARVRSEPATEKQKEKLRWFGCVLDKGMTKGQASDAIDKCVKDFPEKDWAYYNRPATEEQLAKLRSRKKTLTYRQAKDLIWERDIKKRHRDRAAEIEKMDYHFIIAGFLRWRVDHYRHLTYSRVKKAAKALDEINPGWTKSTNHENLLLQKVSQLYPEIEAKGDWF